MPRTFSPVPRFIVLLLPAILAGSSGIPRSASAASQIKAMGELIMCLDELTATGGKSIAETRATALNTLDIAGRAGLCSPEAPDAAALFADFLFFGAD